MNLIIKAILPTFSIIALGYLAGKFNLLGKKSEKFLTNYVFYFALPAILFFASATTPIKQSFNTPFIYAFLASSMVLYVLGLIVAKLFLSLEIKSASICALAIAFPNTAFIGIPILMSLFGERAILPAAVASILANIFMLLTIFIIELNNRREKFSFYTVMQMIRVTIFNPMIIAVFVGIFIALFNWQLPIVINKFFHYAGMTAAPCALIVIGLMLVHGHFFANKIEFSVVAFLRLILHPLLMLLAIWVFKVADLWAVCGFVLAALPSATTTVVIAQKYRIYERRSSALVFETTLASIITLSIVVALIPSLFVI